MEHTVVLRRALPIDTANDVGDDVSRQERGIVVRVTKVNGIRVDRKSTIRAGEQIDAGKRSRPRSKIRLIH